MPEEYCSCETKYSRDYAYKMTKFHNIFPI